MRRAGALALAAALAASGPAARAQEPGKGLAGAPPGAPACSGCHAANAAMGALFGRPADEIAAALAEYRAGRRPATVMNRIATGFDEAESRALAAWLAAQEPAQ